MESKTALLLSAPLLALGLALAAWWWRARSRRLAAVALVPPEVPARTLLVFEPGPARGTATADFTLHAPDWKAEMAALGARLTSSGVAATVFVNGTFVGTDPLSAVGVVERALPDGMGTRLGQLLREQGRKSVSRLLGDLGHFADGYVRLFEEAVGQGIASSLVTWSSENNHVGRVEGALRLVRALATHAELAERESARLLVLGHSHAGQLFALVTQLLAGSVSAEAIVDVARARRLDVSALETDLDTLGRAKLDFVTFGAPARYAWAALPSVRVLHVLGVPSSGGSLDGDWIQRLGAEGSDLPPLSAEDRRVNSQLAAALGPSFSPLKLAAALRADPADPAGAVVLVQYGGKGLWGLLANGHAAYTRLDAMLFHARLIADRLYPEGIAVAAAAAPARRWRWSRAP